MNYPTLGTVKACPRCNNEKLVLCTGADMFSHKGVVIETEVEFYKCFQCGSECVDFELINRNEQAGQRATKRELKRRKKLK